MIEFEYKGKIYYTENLDKKLKRLKIKSRDEITIINENSSHGQKKQEEPDANDIVNYPRIYIYNDADNQIIMQPWWDPNVPVNMDNLCNIEYFLWDPETKTGTDKRFTKEWCQEHLHILKGKPIFPLQFINGELQLDKNCKEWICGI